jgi:hypothetical protein
MDFHCAAKRLSRWRMRVSCVSADPRRHLASTASFSSASARPTGDAQQPAVSLQDHYAVIASPTPFV